MEETKVHAPTEAMGDSADVDKNKTIAALSYLIFFLPLITDAKSSKFAMFHANQGLLLLIASVASNMILPLIPVLGWILWPFAAIAILVFFVLGLMNALNGKMKELPVIGKYNLINK